MDNVQDPINGSDFSLVINKARKKAMLYQNYKILFSYLLENPLNLPQGGGFEGRLEKCHM